MLHPWSVLYATLAVVCLGVPAAVFAGPVEFYVAPDGRDADPGTEEKPLATLEAARDAIRRLKGTPAAAAGGFTVWVRGGVHPRTATFELTAEDSGTATAPGVYRAYAGEQARLVGGQEIPWAWFGPVSDPAALARLDKAGAGRVLQADLKAHDLVDYGPLGLGGNLELFCGDRPMQLARWPNEGRASALREGEPESTRFTVSFEGSPPRRWERPDEVLLQGYWQAEYSASVVKADEVKWTAEGGKIALELRSGPYRMARRFCALNALEELDQPGEWHLDREGSILFFLPPEDGRRGRVMVSMLQEPMVRLSGVSHVTLRGLTLEVMRATAVAVEGGTDNLLAGCTIRNTGADAVYIGSGTNHRVLGCDIHDIGTTAITLAGGDRRSLTSSGMRVENCHIHHYARLGGSYQPALRLRGVGHHIAHNLIHDAPHSAILYGEADSANNDLLIELNEFHDVVLETSDSGVLYAGFDWSSRGNVVRHNFFHHIPHLPDGYTRVVYMDDGHCSTATIGNVFYKAHQAVWIGGGRDNLVDNNIFIECEVPVGMDNRGLRWTFLNPDGDILETSMYKKLAAFDYKSPPWSTRYPELVRILDEHPRAPLGNTLRRNVSVRSPWRDPEKACRDSSGKHIEQKYMTIEDNYVTDEDPGFVDAAHMNFQLREDSIVYRKVPGFERIPFDRIGPYQDEYRASWPLARDRAGDR